MQINLVPLEELLQESSDHLSIEIPAGIHIDTRPSIFRPGMNCHMTRGQDSQSSDSAFIVNRHLTSPLQTDRHIVQMIPETVHLDGLNKPPQKTSYPANICQQLLVTTERARNLLAYAIGHGEVN